MHEIEAGILANIISEVPNATQTEGIRIVSGKDINLKQYAGLEPDWVLHHMDYILVENTKIQSNGNLFHIAGRKLNKRIIFYNSEIGNIRISDSTCSAIYFVNSKCGNIDLTRDSEIGRLIFSDNTKGGNIALSGDKTRITELVAQRNASLGNIDLQRNAGIKFMHLNKRGICKDITLQGQSSFGYLDLKFSSTCRNISVWDRSMLSGMQALTHCMIGNINVAGEAVVNSCRINDHCIADDIECSGQGQLRDLHIRDSICGEINYTENQGPADLHILGGVLNGISLTDATMAAISVQDSCFYFHSENSSVGTLELNECQILNLIWKMGSKGEVFINGSTLLHLDFTNMALTKETLFSLSDCQVQYCIMDNLFVQGQLLLKRLYPLQERFEWQSHVSNRIIHYSHDPIITGRINAVTEKIRRHFSSTLLNIFAAFNPGVADHFYSLRDHLFQKYGRDFEREPETMQLQTEGHWFTFNSTGNRETDIDALKQLVIDKYYTIASIFRLCYTSLGKTEIIDSNLNGFRFEFLNSKLLDCFISGTQLSKNSIKIHIYDPNSVQSLDEEVVFEQRVSFYSQLKKVFDNQGNVVETSWYHARSMESQQRLLNLLLRKQPGSWVKRLRSDRFWDVVTFWLNKQSNYHGESWGRALKFLLLTSIILYSCYFASIHYHESFSLSGLSLFIGDYFSFLDITHRIDFHVPKEQLSGLSKFFDYFGKVLTGYGVFQLIAAFRRHGKKGV